MPGGETYGAVFLFSADQMDIPKYFSIQPRSSNRQQLKSLVTPGANCVPSCAQWYRLERTGIERIQQLQIV